jgi:hypothetical protein
MHIECQRAGFLCFFHLFVPLRGLIFPYNPDYPACPPISGGYLLPALRLPVAPVDGVLGKVRQIVRGQKMA